LIVSAATTERDRSFTVVFPHGFGTSATLEAALDAAGIAHRAGSFPADPGDAGSPIVYVVEAERLGALGSPRVVAQALALIAGDGEATTVVVADPGAPSVRPLADDPHVGGWLVRPLDPAAAVATLRSAGALLRERAEARRLRARAGALVTESDRLLQIGMALTAERDVARLHATIVRNARELTRADSGSLYVLEHDAGGGATALRFAVAQTGPDDAGTHRGAVLPLSRASMSGYVALGGEVLRIDDAYEIPADAEYRFNRSFDERNGYRTKSVLAAPMRDHNDTIVGVIMLINRKPSFDLVLDSPHLTETVVEPFTDHDERVLLSLASQAGVALENKALIASIQALFEHFVRASVKAIEVRDTATQGHSERVAALTVAHAEAVSAVEAGPFRDLYFTDDALREMRYAALLHDFGKVAVPEYIFGKAKKLPDGKLEAIRLRFLLAIHQIEALGARRTFDLVQAGAALDDARIAAIHAETSARTAELHELLETVVAANEPRIVAADVGERLAALAGRTYRDLIEERPLLEPAEFDFLRIPRGSLSRDERFKMEQHVTQSFYFLREIPWNTTPWRNVPELAYGHHEHLDGTGYPRGLKAEQIAPQVRMLTIADVFDALTANDRPYKTAMPVARALDILDTEFAQRGKIDAALLDLFITKRVYAAAGGTRAT
jgi:HD-GYP domain-containing protein (c-di-GMP phosphodiesterase class II)